LYTCELSRLCDEEEELSEVTDSDAVPEQVKDWLTSTFTRSLTNVRRRDERLRFRSVANAIRAGIVVDRYFTFFSSTQPFTRMSSRSRRLGLETLSRQTNVSSRSRLGLGALRFVLGLGPFRFVKTLRTGAFRA